MEMANLMVSKTSKHLISSHPTLCGGFLLVLLMTFIAVASRERAEKKERLGFYAVKAVLRTSALGHWNWRALLFAINLLLPMHAPQTSLQYSVT